MVSAGEELYSRLVGQQLKDLPIIIDLVIRSPTPGWTPHLSHP